MKFNKNIILFILAIVLLLWILSPMFENFSSNQTVLVPIGSPTVGLRGDPLHWSSIDKLYIRPDRQIRLSDTGAMMWDANESPTEQGIPDCYKVDCPILTGGYDKTDSCYKCRNKPYKMTMQDLWEHTKI